MYLEELFSLKGKVAVITGASKGIGQTAAIGLAKAGARVVILCRSEPKGALEGIAAAGEEGCWIDTDVTDEASVNAAFAEILRRFGAVHVVFNNAGICIHEDSVDAPVEDFHTVMNVNFFGEFLVARAAAKMMIDQGIHGSIVNMASMSGSIVNLPQWQCAYNASKAGVIQLTKSLAIEWAKRGVRVNSISPGYIGTDLTLSSPDLKPLIAQWNAMAPMGRLGKPSELQGICVYLAGDASSFTTGADFVIDGAFTCF